MRKEANDKEVCGAGALRRQVQTAVPKQVHHRTKTALVKVNERPIYIK